MGAKSKTIRRVIRAKMEEWFESITDLEVREIAKKNAFVTGGSIASMLIGENIKDFDVYLKTKESVIAVSKYYIKEFIKNTSAKGEHYVPQIREKSVVNLKGETEDRVMIYIQSAGAVGEGGVDSEGIASISEEKSTGGYRYFEQNDNADGDAADEYVRAIVGAKESEDKGKPYRPVFLSQNAITLSNKIQIVIRFFGQPEEIYKNYDFVHVMQHYDYDSNQLHLNAKSLESLISRTLVYSGSLYPICSVFRAKKFIERGWKISAGQYLKMCYQISKINFSDMDMLYAQLQGVDAAYFHQLISILNENHGSAFPNGCKEIDGNYLVALIDKIFEEG